MKNILVKVSEKYNQLFHKTDENHSFMECLFLNALMCIVFYLFFHSAFENIDDFTLKMICSGGFGEPDYHMVFVNCILGFIISGLYKITNSVAWYEIIQILFIWLSFSIITYVLSNKSKISFILLPIIIGLVSFGFYTSIQYSKTASISAIAGYLLLEYKLSSKNKISPLAILMISYSMSMRKKFFFITSLLCIFIFLPELLKLLRKGNKSYTYFKKLLLSGFICLLILGGTYGLDRILYSSDEWKNYEIYNTYRAELMDNGWPDYETNIEIYEKYGIDENAMELYNHWNFNDPEKINLTSMKELIATKGSRTIDFQYIKTFIKNLIKHVISERIQLLIAVVIAALFFAYLFKTRFSSNTVALLLTYIAYALCSFYSYYIRNNGFVARLSLSLIAAVLFVTLYLTSELEIKKIDIPLALAGILLFSYMNYQNLKCFYSETYAEENRKLQILETINNDSEHLYVKRETDTLDFIDSLFVTFDQPLLANLQGMGEWTTNSPLVLNIQEKYNIPNYYKDIVNNDKVYFTDDRDIDDIVEYIRKNYYPTAEAIVVNEIDGYFVYKIVAE